MHLGTHLSSLHPLLLNKLPELINALLLTPAEFCAATLKLLHCTMCHLSCDRREPNNF